MDQNAHYIQRLVRAVLTAADCLQYDNACTLLRLGLDYGPEEGVPDEVRGAWADLKMYENLTAKPVGDIDPHAEYLTPALKRLEKWLDQMEYLESR